MTSLTTSSRKLQRKKTVEMPPQAVSSGISWGTSMRGSPIFTRLSRITSHKSAGYDTASCSRRLQNAIKYWTRWCLKQVRLAKESNNSATVSPRFTKCCTDIQADQAYSHTGYDVTSCFRFPVIEVRKMAKMPLSTAFGRIFVARRFPCPTSWWREDHQI